MSTNKQDIINALQKSCIARQYNLKGMVKMTGYQNTAFLQGYKQSRQAVKFSVKKQVEGNGLKYDDYFRQDSYHEAIEHVYKAIEEQKVCYIPGLQRIISGKKVYPLKAFLCKIARYKYYDNFRRKNALPLISLDSEEMQSIEYQPSLRQSRVDTLQNIEFSLYCSTHFNDRDRKIIRLLIEQYSTKEIAKEVELSPSQVNRIKQRIGAEVLNS
jgi:RNA polymerase sigma factor (sigma-70 family)